MPDKALETAKVSCLVFPGFFIETGLFQAGFRENTTIEDYGTIQGYRAFLMSAAVVRSGHFLFAAASVWPEQYG